jgi:adenine specific DNA methylase Mod
VPEGKLSHFEQLIRDYLEQKRDKNGRVLDHKRLRLVF